MRRYLRIWMGGGEVLLKDRGKGSTCIFWHKETDKTIICLFVYFYNRPILFWLVIELVIVRMGIFFLCTAHGNALMNSRKKREETVIHIQNTNLFTHSVIEKEQGEDTSYMWAWGRLGVSYAKKTLVFFSFCSFVDQEKKMLFSHVQTAV